MKSIQVTESINTTKATTETGPTINTKKDIPLVPVLAVIFASFALLIVGFLLFFNTAKDQNKSSNANDTSSSETETNPDTSSDGITLIKNIGVDLRLLPFPEEKLGEYDQAFFDFGFQIEANSAREAGSNPQPTFIVPLGTEVYSLIDGVVIGIPELYSGDYSVHVGPTKNSNVIYETEHVINLKVKVGDKVKAGDVLAEVSDYEAHNYAGYGLVEIGILIGGNPPSHICPFNYLHPSIKTQTQDDLRNFYKRWNEFRGKQVYDEKMAIPGCISLDPVEG